jgi:hypothetical protein
MALTPFEKAESNALSFGSGMVFYVAFAELLEREAEVERAAADPQLDVAVRLQAKVEANLIRRGLIDAGSVLAGMGISA